MSEPLVTVIMSVFNEEAYVPDAIRAVLEQTYQDFELLIVDDYSTGRSMEMCRCFKDARIRIADKTNEPRYLASSRNMGVHLARGACITLQDPDDTSAPQRVE